MANGRPFRNVKVIKPQKAHLHTLRDVCVPDEINPSPVFQRSALETKRGLTDGRTDGRTSEATQYPPPPSQIRRAGKRANPTKNCTFFLAFLMRMKESESQF